MKSTKLTCQVLKMDRENLKGHLCLAMEEDWAGLEGDCG